MKKLLLLLAGFALSTIAAQATVITVLVSDFVFTPANITAHVGDTVMWVWSNRDHTTTSGSIPTGATSWNSPITTTNPIFRYKLTKAGTYNYVCTPHASLGMVGTISVSPTGIETAANGPIRIAPNPANNVLEVALPEQNHDVAVKLLDIQGRLVFEGNVASGKTLSIPTSDIPTGLYQVALQLDGSRFTESIIIRH